MDNKALKEQISKVDEYIIELTTIAIAKVKAEPGKYTAEEIEHLHQIADKYGVEYA